MTTRREKIEEMLRVEPEDTFLRYSLALEYDKEGDAEKSLEGLQALMASTPPYVPAFHMSGQQLVRAGRITEARTVLRDGIEVARQQNDQHAAAEMSELLASLGELGE